MWTKIKSFFSSPICIYIFIIIVGFIVYSHIKMNNTNSHIVNDTSRIDSLRKDIDSIKIKIQPIDSKIDSTNIRIDSIKLKVINNDSKISVIQKSTQKRDSVINNLPTDSLQQLLSNY